MLSSFFKFGSKKTHFLCKVLGDTMGTVGEIYIFVKFSLKRKTLPGTTWKQVEEKVDDENEANQFPDY